MNYRHAFHAGNHADVLKHLVLARVLAHLCLKDKPFRALDAFAGLGVYDLGADEARRTGEWRDGWGRLEAPFPASVEALLAPYRAVVAATRARHGEATYPGSPAVIREFLRPGDRGVFVELHPDDAAVLRDRYNSDTRTKVLHLDGWTAVNAQIPPPERRGLVLIDPPYEVPGEIDRLGAHLLRAVAKWPTGVFLAWYPIKDVAAIDRLAAQLDAGLRRPALRLDLHIHRPDEATRLNGSGLVVVNPPWRLAEDAEIFLPALAERLAQGAYGGYRCEALAQHSAA
ncbi:23S rRNA (adenine(2030)-N(6))-methyltransferase RlmJ [Methylobacterium aerolatum]|uniref:Ribosomal RNA large subunit methyltransferase J n=1 Tax=Methylobacterium aerolatum TaxID=418708 RepID=A0ABU0I5R1_9HYPH|nr:23S rRNA (adenine(2030)-N(6))-methyltransferase RlmJ [Methylobacterium aerolatum]MDQ0449368.1 23S rRNA (adenine2030-N6)-methyltransferase [Methylobacterium aerolatum]GJD36683.1 Ribosomal RNA large subunit methyltransferase J [Methylobacterium aerolatum]